MKINLKIHSRNHILKAILGTLEIVLTGLKLKKKGLYVVNYHGTQNKFLSNFKEQISFFKKHFHILFPEELPDFYSDKLTKGPYLLITFDDGIKNNLAAAQLLNEQGIKAFFFIVPEFINTPVEKQKDYFIRCIRPHINFEIDINEEDFQAMSWEDVGELVSQGHRIGSHTLTHTLITTNTFHKKSRSEIIGSKEIIVSRLKEKIECFCSINNTLESTGKDELKLITLNYTYHFTTIPGVNLPTSSKYYIKRCNIESHWLMGAVHYALGSWDLNRWKNADTGYLKLMKELDVK